MRYRIWSEPSGAVKITTFLDDPGRSLEVLLAEGHVHPLSTVLDTDDLSGLLPATKRFRSAWRLLGGRVRVDLPLARASRMTEMRAERDARLNESDKTRLQAMDDNDTAYIARLKTYRQALRDLPVTAQTELDARLTDTDIEAWIPTWPTAP